MLTPLFKALDLGKTYGYHEIFRNVEFLVRTGDKIGLVGPNGVGKTTLLRIIAGLESPTNGKVIRYQNPLVIGYVAQIPTFDSEVTVVEELSREWSRLGLAAQASVEETLSRFGFSEHDRTLAVAQLSGGQRTRLGLAKAWLSRPDLLLLDEPTNHLDQDGLSWLEQFLRNYLGTVIIVSHDRYFLDQVVTRILELSANGVVEYEGNYTDYRNAKKAAFEAQLARYEKDQKEIRRIEAAIERQLRWAEKAHRNAGKQTEIRMGTKEFYRAKSKKMMSKVKSTVKRLEKLKETRVEKPRREQAIALTEFAEVSSGRRLILAKNLTKTFGKPLFSDASFTILRGDKVGIVGPNGAGKTTLVKMILGLETISEGQLWVSPGARIGYLDQEIDALSPTDSVLEGVLSVLPYRTAENITRVRTLLDGFLFSPSDIEKPMGVLSTGERKRVALARLLLSDFNLLILDEPTDHLDLPSRERLEDALAAYGGTLILVSHDRYLLQRVCTKILAIEMGKICEFHGGFAEFYNTNRQKNGSGKSNQRGELTKEEILLLENRLAVLNSQLSLMSGEDPNYRQLEAEFFAVSEKLRNRGGQR